MIVRRTVGEALADVPELEGWITLSRAAEDYLGISRQAVHKMAATRRLRTLRRIGDKPLYVVREAEVAELQRQKEAGIPEDQLGTPEARQQLRSPGEETSGAESPGGDNLQ